MTFPYVRGCKLFYTNFIYLLSIAYLNNNLKPLEPLYNINIHFDVTLYHHPCGMRRGERDTPWDQVIENEFEYLSDRGVHGFYLAEKFSKKYLTVKLCT